MSDFLGIDLIAGLDEDQSGKRINKAIENIQTSGKLDDLKIKLDIDEKALKTISDFNREMQKLSQVAERTGQTVKESMSPSNVKDTRAHAIQETMDKMQRAGQIAEQESKKAEDANIRETQSVNDLLSRYTLLNKEVEKRNKHGEITEYRYDVGSRDGVHKGSIYATPDGMVIRSQFTENYEKQTRDIERATKERERILARTSNQQQELFRRLAQIESRYGENVNKGTIQFFNKSIIDGDVESLKRLSKNMSEYESSLSNLQRLEKARMDMFGKVSMLESSVFGNISPEHQQQLRGYLDELMKMDEHTPNLAQNIQRLNAGFTQTKHEIMQADQGMARFNRQLASAMFRIPIYAAGMAAMYAPMRMFQDAIRQSIEIDAQMTVLERVSSGTIKMNDALEDSVEIANKLGNVISEVNDGLIAFARQGYRGGDLAFMTEYATVMSNVSDLSVDEAASSLTAAMKGFNIEAENSIHIVNALNEVNVNQPPCTVMYM